MSTVRDLRDTLREQAADVTDFGAPSRADAARRRAKVIKRRRTVTAAAAVAAAVAIPIAAAALVNVDSSTRGDLSPVHPPSKSDVFDQPIPGRTLLESKYFVGESETTMTFEDFQQTEWRPVCVNAGANYVLHVQRDEEPADTATCDVQLDTGVRMGYLFPFDPTVTEPPNFRLWLTLGPDGRQTAPPEAVLGMAVYRVPKPVETLLGQTVLRVDSNDGEAFVFHHHDISKKGERSFTSSWTAGKLPVSVDWFSAGSGTPSQLVEILIDGRPETSMRLGEGASGVVLDAGRQHRVELRIQGQVPPDSQLAIVWRTAAP